MTNSTPTYWDVDGVSLQTMCQNVESLAPKWTVPTKRGEDTKVAYRHGVRHRPKWMEPKPVALGMWVTGMGPDGAPTALGMERQFEKNMRALRSLVWREDGAQVALTKRWRDPDTGSIRSATAQAEMVGDMEPTMQGPYSAKIVLEFLLADPLYYGPVQTITLQRDVAQDVAVLGDVTTRQITLAVVGALDSAQITNQTRDTWVRLGSSVASGDQVVLDVDNYTAIRQSDDANLIGAVTRSGARQWMELAPGTQTLKVTGASGSGHVDLLYAPAYL